MKKVITIALAFLAVVSANATSGRKKVAEYSVNGLPYSIEAEYTKHNELSIYIETLGEYEGTSVLLNIQGQENIEQFISEMDKAREKYAEWKKIAAKNDITDFKKDFDFNSPEMTVCWPRRSDKTLWWFSDTDTRNFTPTFRVVKSPVYGIGYYFVITNRVEATENSYVSTKFTLAFSREKDIQGFINAINPEKIQDKLDKAIEKSANLDELFR